MTAAAAIAITVGCIIAIPTVAAQHAAALTPPTPDGGSAPLKGYVRTIAGDRLDYMCFNPLASTALLTRCTTGDMNIEWETEAVPTNAAGQYVEFTWIVSYSTVTSAANRTFAFFINDAKTFDIKSQKGVNPKHWTETAADGSELSFQLVKPDAAGDANGYMTLKVALARVKKGEPLRLRVVGEKANSSDWFMTFAYDLRDATIEVLPLPYLVKGGSGLEQTVCVAITYAKEKGQAVVSVDGGTETRMELVKGPNTFDIQLPAVQAPREIAVSVAVDGNAPERVTATVKPVMKRTIYLLPHAHNDIGYTDIQTEVLKKHVKNIYDALGLIKKTASYPAEARFKWNTEVSWAVETFMANGTEAERNEFISAVKGGSISLQALFSNNLTGIMRPEEFFRLSGYSRSLKEKYGLSLTTAMMSDIPGMTWNMVPAVAQAGITYFSSGPNGTYLGGDRTGHTNRAWADRPFYWVSPSGTERVLYWVTGFGYGSFFAGVASGNASRISFLRSFFRYFEWLDSIAYPYDMIQMRHTIGGDNGTVDPDLPQYVKDWNAKFVSPKIVIATAEQLFSEFERKYGDVLPAVTGDFTPYWEDGAASTAYELGVNRTSAEQLVQTEALSALIAPAQYDEAKFYDAWKRVILFDEHTWGAHNSINDPDSSFQMKQWDIKRQFAMDGARASAELREAILAVPSAGPVSSAFDVINTNSWNRTDLVVIPQAGSTTGDVVRDEKGNAIPSQRLSSGDLAFLALDVPALGAKRYTIHAGASAYASDLRIGGTTLSDANLEVVLSGTTGAITRLRTLFPAIDYVDTTQGGGLNEFLYMAGLDAREAVRNGRPSITVKERGPLVASFVAVSDAPGCNSLTREIRMVSGAGRVDVINTIDKKMVRTKESVHFGFPFSVPEAVTRIDLGFAVIRPEADQLPGSCKDYFSAQRWADVSNQDYGVTLTVSEAPLVEVGDLNSELPSPRNPYWKTSAGSSPRLASYVMNNYWHTNYKADQEGVSSYHYSILPHGQYNQVDVMRAGIERSQPFVVRQVEARVPKPAALFEVVPRNILVSYLKPVNGGHGYIVRLFNAGGSPETAMLTFTGGPRSIYMSSPAEEKGKKVAAVDIPANGIVTVRVE
jgi:alpha-mannosidase